MTPVMTSSLRDDFSLMAVNKNIEFEPGLSELQKLIEEKIYGWPASSDHTAPERKVSELFNRCFRSLSKEKKLELERCICSRLALQIPRLLAGEDFPESILRCYGPALLRIRDVLRGGDSAGGFSPLTAYIRFFSIINVPCGAESVDVRSRIPISSVVLSAIRMRNLRPMLRFFSCGVGGVWLRAHLDSSCLADFNREGLDQFYFRVAELLRRREHLRGLVSTSWFRDPEVGRISPRLAYLYSDPVGRGAFVMRHRMTSFDIDNATKTSATRRQLYEAGIYRPTSYSLVWPRAQLIEWSNKVGVSCD